MQREGLTFPSASSWAANEPTSIPARPPADGGAEGRQRQVVHETPKLSKGLSFHSDDTFDGFSLGDEDNAGHIQHMNLAGEFYEDN